jgi:hypothetical protein
MFIENMDKTHHKTTPIPLGINPRECPNFNTNYITKYMKNIPKIVTRPLKTICIHRIRAGDRQKIAKLDWGMNIITQKTGAYKHDSWIKLMQKYPFIICAHGGGIDPCPKAWEALCVGCIPIIKKSSLDTIFDGLPVVKVNDWDNDTITVENMKSWLKQYSRFYDDDSERQKWLPKLYTKYWCDKITSYL